MTRSLERTRAFSVSFAQAASLTGIPLCKRTLPHNVFHVADAVAVVVGLIDMVDGGGGRSLSCGCEALWRWLSLLVLTIRPPSRVGPLIFLASRVCSGSGRRLGFLEVPGRCSTHNRPIGGLRQHSKRRDSMTKATAPVASTAQGSRTQRLTGSMAPVHRHALGT